ncbi:MAG TPA: hypothetical protein VMG55_10505 [Stellaceae bacterium]|nr:hypothetical protein [Stellaceae bacterium]
MTLQRVKASRNEEAERAAAILGGELHLVDIGDYPMRVSEAHLERPVSLSSACVRSSRHWGSSTSTAPKTPTRGRL